MQRSLHRLRDERDRRRARCRTCATASSRCTAGSCTRCSTAVSGPDRGYAKCARVVGDVMGNYHPHGDSSIYDTLVRMAQPWSMRLPAGRRSGQLRLAGQRPGRRPMRYTECRLTPLAMEMLREIDEETVDFSRTTTAGRRSRRSAEPVPEPAGQRLGRHRGRHGDQHPAAQPARGRRRRLLGLENPDADDEETLAAVMERIKGPDFPTGGLIVGRQGIEDTYTTGRGSIRMRGVVEIEEDSRGPHQHRRHRAAVPGQPRQLHHLDRRAGPRRQARRHRQHRGPVQRPRRPAHRRQAQARRGGQGGAEQPLQAHPAADQLRRQHAGDRRRGAAHAAAGPDDPALRQPPARRHRPAHHLPAAQGQRAGPHPARSGQGARRARRGHRADPGVGDRRTSPGRPDRAARHRRDPGPGDPRHAAAPAGRTGTAAHRRRPRQDRGRDRRPGRHPGQAGAPARDRPRRAQGDRRQVRRRPAHPASSPPTATSATRT